MNKNYEIKVFCENVQYLRMSNNLSYKEMADILHISVKTLKLLEAGELTRSVGVDVVWRINKYFGITPSQQFKYLQSKIETSLIEK